MSARARQRLGRRCGRGEGAAGNDGRITVESALAVCNLKERLVERSRRIGRGQRGARAFTVKTGDRAIDRIHALLHLRLGGATLGNQLIEPAVELGNRLDELARRLLVAPVRARYLRIRDLHLRELADLLRQAVEAILDLDELARRLLIPTVRAGDLRIRDMQLRVLAELLRQGVETVLDLDELAQRLLLPLFGAGHLRIRGIHSSKLA